MTEWRYFKTNDLKFNRLELAGSLGDLGTLIPLSVAMILLCDLSFTTVFTAVGLYYLFSGLFFRLPLPVQPLKVVSAIAIASPMLVTIEVLSATGLIFGFILIIIAFTGVIEWIAKLFTTPIVRGIQLGLGLILIKKGINLILLPSLFPQNADPIFLLWGIPINVILGVCGCFLTLALITNKLFPAALVMISIGILIGFLGNSLDLNNLLIGPTPVELIVPSQNDFLLALTLLVLPQLPLTIGNAIIGTAQTSYSLFGKGEKTQKVTNRSLSASMGIANIIIGAFGGIPTCHGAGGLAAHYRFGARTGGSNIMIGVIFIFIALVFGRFGIALISSVPNAVLGVLLIFAGLELAVLIRDMNQKNELFISVLIASIGFITTNMGIAFLIGFITVWIIRVLKIKL